MGGFHNFHLNSVITILDKSQKIMFCSEPPNSISCIFCDIEVREVTLYSLHFFSSQKVISIFTQCSKIYKGEGTFKSTKRNFMYKEHNILPVMLTSRSSVCEYLNVSDSTDHITALYYHFTVVVNFQDSRGRIISAEFMADVQIP